MTYAADSCEFLARLHDNLSLVLVMIAVSQKNSHETITKTNQLLKPHQCLGKVGKIVFEGNDKKIFVLENSSQQQHLFFFSQLVAFYFAAYTKMTLTKTKIWPKEISWR